VIIIPSGAADAPLDELDGLTPLEAADMPNLSAIAKRGRLGTVRTIPDGFAPATDTALLTILGYPAGAVHPGRAGFTALPLGVNLADHDWAFCVNFITVDEDTGTLIHPTAGYVEPSEARLLLESLSEALGERLAEEAFDLEFFTGRGEEHLLVDRSGRRSFDDVETTPPMEVVDRPTAKFLPRPPAASRGASKEPARLLNRIMEISADVFRRHDVNETRRELGEPVCSQVWIWGEGRRAALPPFRERFPGLRAEMMTTDDLAGGIAQAAGWSRFDLYDDQPHRFPGIPRGDDFLTIPEITDVASRAVQAIESNRIDLICCYIESPDEAAYDGDFAGKIAALEAIDRDLIGPVWEALRDANEDGNGEHRPWRLAVLPEICTLTGNRKRDARPVPFALAGRHVEAVLRYEGFGESNANASDLHIEPGTNLMEYLLFSGLPKRK